MPQVEKLLVFLASPGDVPTERRYAEEVINDLNRSVASDKGVVLLIVNWENNAFPGYGQDAQALINAQIAEMSMYALFVGIMWNRLGTPTPRADSGTVEEFERAVEAFKRKRQPDIWFYFRQSSSKLDTEDQLEQRKKVLAFKKEVQANGMPWTYKSPADFRDKFRNQMILWLNARTQTTSEREKRWSHKDARQKPQEESRRHIEEEKNRAEEEAEKKRIASEEPRKATEAHLSEEERQADEAEERSRKRGSSELSFTETPVSVDRLNLNRFKPIDVIARTGHSLIQTCLYNGMKVVLKRTREDFCDLDALRILIKAAADPLEGWPRSVRSVIGVPQEAWTQDDFLWELYDFYSGISVGDLVLRTRQILNGRFLAFCAESLTDILMALRSTGLIHRDLNPFNLILTHSGELRLIDWSFCTKLGRQAIPIVTPGYTAPEQERGVSSVSSDWYSMGATLYYLANGVVPPPRGTAEYERGIKCLYTDGHKPTFLVDDRRDEFLSSLCDTVLEPNPDIRPLPTYVGWGPATVVWESFPNLRVFDLGAEKCLLVTDHNFWILPKDLERVSMELTIALRLAGQPDPVVTRLVEQYRRQGS